MVVDNVMKDLIIKEEITYILRRCIKEEVGQDISVEVWDFKRNLCCFFYFEVSFLAKISFYESEQVFGIICKGNNLELILC